MIHEHLIIVNHFTYMNGLLFSASCNHQNLTQT